MPLLYDLAAGGYHSAVRAAAPFNAKARAWAAGRAGLWERLEAKKDRLRGCLWMHCASVGEFEQGRPVLEALKAARPGLPVLLTFFSPSGYEARKDYPGATHVDYLPPDNAGNARRLADLITPRAAIFVKYEFWYHHLHALKERGVPVFLVSGIFREDQPFFKWYGGPWRSMLRCYAHLFMQDERSRALLAGAGITNITVSGDTRFDRVLDIVREGAELPIAAAMTGGAPVLVCGSTWPADDALITKALYHTGEPLRTIVAPHEHGPAQLHAIERDYPGPVVRWSALDDTAPPVPLNAATLLVDRMGLLARLYKYGDIAYVGGGFGDGIHSILEAATWGRPVIFGPRHTKFPEAKGLIGAGAAWQVGSAEDLMALLRRLFNDRGALARAGEAAAAYVHERAGATERTVGGILAMMG